MAPARKSRLSFADALSGSCWIAIVRLGQLWRVTEMRRSILAAIWAGVGALVYVANGRMGCGLEARLATDILVHACGLNNCPTCVVDLIISHTNFDNSTGS